MGKTGATLNRGGSKQTYRTPEVFLDACEARFGKIGFDLAAHSRNCVVPDFFSRKDDSLRQDWSTIPARIAAKYDCPASVLAWLNPPFSRAEPWAKMCARNARPDLRILLLVRASVDSEWFYDHIYGNALVMPLRQRIKFVGAKDPYPSSLMLCYFDGGQTTGFEPWRWADQWTPTMEAAAE